MPGAVLQRDPVPLSIKCWGSQKHVSGHEAHEQVLKQPHKPPDQRAASQMTNLQAPG